jgi:ethanolamine utilization protein EutN
MFIGKVTGTVVATQKIATVVGKKLLLVEAMTVKGPGPGSLQSTGRVAVAVDTVGAGEGELVIVTQGSSARLTEMTSNVPTDAVVVGIIDAIQAGSEELYKKEN